MKQPLSVIFLWHMHQPYYKDPLRGEYILPWTYLHGIKDYYDMAAIVDEVAGARAVFNLVPSLLEQLEEYAAGQAIDPFLSRGRMHPADMGEDDRLFILENFFAANRQRLIEPVRRYFELFCLSGGDGGERARDRLRLFRDQDILDLQVCFFLAWTGEAARRRHPALQELVRKGSGYTAAAVRSDEQIKDKPDHTSELPLFAVASCRSIDESLDPFLNRKHDRRKQHKKWDNVIE